MPFRFFLHLWFSRALLLASFVQRQEWHLKQSTACRRAMVSSGNPLQLYVCSPATAFIEKNDTLWLFRFRYFLRNAENVTWSKIVATVPVRDNIWTFQQKNKLGKIWQFPDTEFANEINVKKHVILETLNNETYQHVDQYNSVKQNFPDDQCVTLWNHVCMKYEFTQIYDRPIAF